MANAYYDKPNFETLLHLVESMLSAGRSRFGYTLPDAHKVAFNAFMDIGGRWERLLEQTSLERFGIEMMANVADFLDEKISESSPEKQGVISAFLRPLREHTNVRIATLNYDDAIERSVDTFWDGFTDQNPAGVDYPGFLHEHPLEVLHLHGSIRFAPPESNAQVMPELRRFASNAEAKPQRLARKDLMFVSQAGEILFNGPMLSGLRKTEKLILEPYGLYHQRLVDGLLRCPRFLSIGYGGNDPYINAAVFLSRRVHGDNFRGVYVTKLNDESLSSGETSRALLLPATHSVTYQPEYAQFLERVRQSDFVIQEKRMFLIGTGFPLNDHQRDQMIDFLFGANI